MSYEFAQECCEGCNFYNTKIEGVKEDSFKCSNPFIDSKLCLDPNRPNIKGIHHSDNDKRDDRV